MDHVLLHIRRRSALFPLLACGWLAVGPAGVARAAPPAADLTASAARIEVDVRFLADDLLEGREAGSRGYDLAALYAAAQYRLIGLEPAGDDGTYFQRVPLLRGIREREGARFALTRDGRRTEFAFETEYLPAVNYSAGSAEVTAPMVFVGQAVHAWMPRAGRSTTSRACGCVSPRT